MTVARRGPLSFLDSEWRTTLWRRWVATHLAAEENRRPEQTPEASATQPTLDVANPTNVAAKSDVERETPQNSNPEREPAPRNSNPEREPAPRRVYLPHDDTRKNERRADVRARFDAISERLQALEDAIDVIARRLSHRARRERRTDRRTAELVESIAESVDAQATALDNLTATLERIERRLDRAERPREEERRDSRAPRARPSEPPRSAHPPRTEEAGDFTFGRDGVDDAEAALSGSSIRGNISDMSLSTVLAMLEIERRSGRLKVQNEDGAIVAFELEDGSVVRSRASENDIDAVESLREVLTWKSGRFWFRQNPSESLISAPRSVNSLLLEATRQLDEAVRAS